MLSPSTSSPTPTQSQKQRGQEHDRWSQTDFDTISGSATFQVCDLRRVMYLNHSFFTCRVVVRVKWDNVFTVNSINVSN